MNNCCSSNNPSEIYPKKYRCPVNGREYSSVAIKTLLHHIKQPWEADIKNQGYYFCDDPKCEIVYFGEDGSIFKKDHVRTIVWQKEKSPNQEVCYCFGVTPQLLEKDDQIRLFIEEQTKSRNCSCETRNPSGRCCLKDFRKQ